MYMKLMTISCLHCKLLIHYNLFEFIWREDDFSRPFFWGSCNIQECLKYYLYLCYTVAPGSFKVPGLARGAPSQADHRILATGPKLYRVWFLINISTLTETKCAEMMKFDVVTKNISVSKNAMWPMIFVFWGWLQRVNKHFFLGPKFEQI